MSAIGVPVEVVKHVMVGLRRTGQAEAAENGPAVRSSTAGDTIAQ